MENSLIQDTFVKKSPLEREQFVVVQIQRKLDAELFELDHSFVAALVEEDGFFIHELATGDAY